MYASRWVSHPSSVREVRGPFPHSFQVLGRPIDPNVYEKELLRRAKVDRIIADDDKKTEFKKIQEKIALQNEFQSHSDKRVRCNVSAARVQDHMQIYALGVEQRKEKLKKLLGVEDENYREESSKLEETIADRVERNRAKIKQLQERREAERLQFVQEKLTQRMANQCDEARRLNSKNLLLEAAADRVEQMNAKMELKMKERHINDVYDHLGQIDLEARARREEIEARRALLLNCDQVKGLQKQMAAKEEKKRKEMQLKEEEMNFLTDQRKLWAHEDELMMEQKHKDKQTMRKMYDQMIRAHREREIGELKSELVFDMKLIEKNMEEKSNEAYETYMNKKATKEETLRYLEYLKANREVEANKEKEIEKVIQAEIKRAQDEQDRKWKLYQEARDRLRCDAAKSINTQRQLKELGKREEKQRNYELDKDIAERLAEVKQIEDDRETEKREKNRQYGQDIVCQIGYNKRQCQAEEDEKSRMFEKQTEAELEYQAKISELYKHPSLTKIHPMRLKLCTHLQNNL